jgi:hypothetical protein
MEKLFRDVNYFVIEAANRTQKGFELDFVDVIEVFDTNEVHLTTEDGKSLIITYDDRGYFKSYFVNREDITAQMAESGYVESRVKSVIETLKNLTYKGDCVDGETMQYIIEKLGMNDQMLRQLVMSNPYTDTTDLLEEKVEQDNKLVGRI